LRAGDRIIAGLCTLFMRRARVLRNAIVLKPSTLLHFHSVLRKRKYRMLFASQGGHRPGPKGPNKDLIEAVVAMKRRNPNWGCPRIAQQIALAFGVEIDKDVVRRILAVHYRPDSDSGGPSWLTFIGHMKDSLWSCDLFRCESATLRTHWVLVVMDQFTRRVIGFGVHSGIVDGVSLCRMFQRAIRGHGPPKYLSSVGSRTGAVLQRSGLSVSPRFLWECLTNRTVSPFPIPAASNPPCGFPAVGFPACFVARFM
jgi:putative transposase